MNPLAAIPLLLAVALSPTAITLSVLLLLGGKGPRTPWIYAAGWALGGAVLLGSAAFGVAQLGGGTGHDRWVGIAEVGIGIMLLLGALAVTALHRRRPSLGSDEQRLLRLVADVTPGRAFALGLAGMLLSLKHWLFLLPAGAHLVAGGTATTLLLVAVGTAIACTGVALPVLLAGGAGGPGRLVAVKAWLLANGVLVAAAVMAAAGLYLVGHGLLSSGLLTA